MRKVFTSARAENAEAVARMLEAEGIEVRLENGRSFRSSIRGNFSYRDGPDTGPRPSVWVVRSDDQPRARHLLREAGLLHEAHHAAGTSYLPPGLLSERRERDARQSRRSALRMRIGLLAAIAIIALAIVFKPRPSGDAAPAASAAGAALATADVIADDAPHTLPTPPALAVRIALHEAQVHAAMAVCLDIDGQDPPDTVLAELRAAGLQAQASAACDAPDALHIGTLGWLTDGSGSGRVDWTLGRGDAPAQARTSSARREGSHWVLGIAH